MSTTVSTPAGTWVLTQKPFSKYNVPQESPRWTVRAIFTPAGATRPTRVVNRENLTDEEVATFSPEASWRIGLDADTHKARALRSIKGGRS
jgi:hypothetical protein